MSHYHSVNLDLEQLIDVQILQISNPTYEHTNSYQRRLILFSDLYLVRSRISLSFLAAYGRPLEPDEGYDKFASITHALPRIREAIFAAG